MCVCGCVCKLFVGVCKLLVWVCGCGCKLFVNVCLSVGGGVGGGGGEGEEQVEKGLDLPGTILHTQKKN